jgi:hypothetical protein
MSDSKASEPPALSLNPELYHPDEKQLAFLKDATGISNEEELKQHVFLVQKEAFDIHEVTPIHANLQN